MEFRANAGTNTYTKAIEAFRLRQLTLTLQWRRFPWTYGAELDQALVGPEYLGSVMIGFEDAWSWGFDFLPTPKGGGSQPASRPVGALPLAGALIPASRTAQRRGLHRLTPHALRRDRCS